MSGSRVSSRRIISLILPLVVPLLIATGERLRAQEPPAPGGVISVGFIENRGQVDEAVLYYALGPGGAVYFTRNAVVLDLRDPTDLPDPAHDPTAARGVSGIHAEDLKIPARGGCAVWIRFEDAKRLPTVEGRLELPQRHNYFLGNDPGGWRTNVPVCAEVVYRDLWPGVDLVYRAEEGVISYEVVAGPKADPDRISFAYEGAERVTARPDGSIRIETHVGSIIDTRPGSRTHGELRRSEGAEAAKTGNGLRENPSSLLWSTFVGGSSRDLGYGVALDSAENPVVVGYTFSADFPTTPGAYDSTFGGGNVDAVVSKLDASGSTLLWSTYLGGTDGESAKAVALDASGNAIVVGGSESTDFPTTTGAYDESLNGMHDVFVTKIAASGNALLWSTFIGGELGDGAQAVVLDAAGNAVLTGQTYSSDYPTTSGAYDETFNDDTERDAFVSKLNASGTDLLWSTFLGGDMEESARGVVLDASGNPIVTGHTESAGFPTTVGAYDESHNGMGDIYVAKLDASGNALLWSTFLGGEGYDGAETLDLDASGNPVVFGTADSLFPTTPGAYDETCNDTWGDAIVAKLNASGTDLLWSTFLGGGDWESGTGVAVDASGDVLVTGVTASLDFPTTWRAYDRSYNGGPGDVFVARLSSSGDALLWSSYLGGSEYEVGSAIAAVPSGGAVVAGFADNGFPTTAGAYDPSHNGGSDDIFASKLDMSNPDCTSAFTIIQVVGDFNEWDAGVPSMTQVESCVWMDTLSIAAGCHRAKFRTGNSWDVPPDYGTCTSEDPTCQVPLSGDICPVAGVGTAIGWMDFEFPGDYQFVLDEYDSTYHISLLGVPQFTTIQVVGDFNGWDTGVPGMIEIEPRVWVDTLSVGSGCHFMKFLTDGVYGTPPDYGTCTAEDTTCQVSLVGETCLVSGAETALGQIDFTDSGVYEFRLNENDATYEITLIAVTDVVDTGNGVPRDLYLGPAIPNPFNPVTEIAYGIPSSAGVYRVSLKIYDATGRRVKTLVDAARGPGTYRVVWDGRDQRGVQAASGVYFYRLAWRGRAETQRMVLLK